MTTREQELFFDVFEALPRQGPGTRASAEQALARCVGLPSAPRVLDLGSGAGAQTLYLAELTGGTVVAVDAHAPLVERLRARLAAAGLEGRVEARVGRMETIEDDRAFDLVWSEGALYTVGLDRVLPACRRALRPGGYLGFTDAVWRVDEPTPAVREAFEADYPTMGRAADVLEALERHDFAVEAHFTLPEEAWWEDFYGPLERRVATLRERYAGDAEALEILDRIAEEPASHRLHGHEYAYEFFVARRPPG